MSKATVNNSEINEANLNQSAVNNSDARSADSSQTGTGKNKQGKLSVHPYIGGTTINLCRNVLKNGGVAKNRMATFVITLAGTLLTFPLRLLEYLLYNKKIQNAELAQDPIFIIGHWRSGTTHLHNVMSQDRRLGYLSTLQAVFPTCSALLNKSKFLKGLIAKLIPEKRMMDNVKMGIDYPQEEEFSVSCITSHSHHCNHFPRTIKQSFDKYVLFNASDEEKAEWQHAYMSVIKKASFLAGGKRLLLKNPYNTARIEVLLKMFPNAKFIHIYRNPYNIYVSALHDFIKEAEEMALQEFSEQEFSELCYDLYKKLMNRYWETKDLIPAGNLCEVSFEAFENNPLGEVERIYTELGLEKTGTAFNEIKQYVDSLKGYKKNKYSYNAALMEKISEKWGFAIKKMNYTPPTDIALDNKADWSCNIDH